MIGPNALAITKAPYKVFSCDQVLVLDGKTFIEPDNYTKRKPQVFTLSAYMINQFDSSDPKSLKNQILLDDITELPDIIHGAPQCINFVSKSTKKIALCMKSEKRAQLVKQAYDKLIECRMGNNLQEMTREDLFREFKDACSGNGNGEPNIISEEKYLKMVNSFLPGGDKKHHDKNDKKKGKNLKKEVKDGDINPAYGNHVPGDIIVNHDKSIHQEK